MSAAAALDERVALERPRPGLAVVRVSGDWALRDGIPPAREVLRGLEAEPPVELRFDASAVGAWDSALVTFVHSLAAFAAARGIAVDAAALPPGARRLLELALAVKPRVAPAPETDDALTARVGTVA